MGNKEKNTKSCYILPLSRPMRKLQAVFFSLMLCRIVFQRKDRAAYIFITYNISGKIAMIKKY